jgi:hypothetical protein
MPNTKSEGRNAESQKTKPLKSFTVFKHKGEFAAYGANG